MEGYNKVVLPVPFRIHSFVTEFGRMYEEKSKHSFGGGFGFSVSTGNYFIVQRSEKRVVKAPYKNVIGRYIDLFKEIYEFDGEFTIELKEEFPKHSGFGSTIVMITTTCAALNILLGNKFSKMDLNMLIFENYCEEDFDGIVVDALTSGIGALVMLYGGIIYMDNGYSFVRTEFMENQEVLLFTTFKKDETKQFDVHDEFELSNEYIQSDLIAKEQKIEMIHKKLIPAMLCRDFEGMGVSNDALNEIGSGYIDAKQYEYDKQQRLFKLLRDAGATLVGISSAGPTAYALIDKSQRNEMKDILLREGIKSETIRVYEVDNRGLYACECE